MIPVDRGPRLGRGWELADLSATELARCMISRTWVHTTKFSKLRRGDADEQRSVWVEVHNAVTSIPSRNITCPRKETLRKPQFKLHPSDISFLNPQAYPPCSHYHVHLHASV